jgi:phenylacetic acid degradation operon negative regulatory protein
MARDPRQPLLPLLQAFHARQPIRAWSLIVTIFGDVIAPRGGEIGMLALSRIMEAIGVRSGVVRTAMSRLATEGWVERVRQGRLSFYRLSQMGALEVEKAAPRIYGRADGEQKASFTIVVLQTDAKSDGASARLRELGFAALASNVHWAPSGEAMAAAHLAADSQLKGALVLDAVPQRGARLSAGAAPSASFWNLGELAGDYRNFIERAEPLREARFDDPLDAVTARILLVHDFRRVALRDPGLPAELCPADWPGVPARRLVREVYGALLPASGAWLDTNAACQSGPLPPSRIDLGKRFAG